MCSVNYVVRSVGCLIVLLAVACANDGVVVGDDSTVEPPQTTGGTRVAVQLSVPDAISGHALRVPINISVPFAQGSLTKSAKFKLEDASGNAIAADFWVTAVWPDQRDSLRWLLVDAVVSANVAAPLALVIDAPEGATAMMHPRVFPTGSLPPVASEQLSALQSGSYGDFVMRSGDAEVAALSSIEQAVIERQGQVLTVLRFDGKYAPSGQPIADHRTRIYLYNDLPYAKLSHSYVWYGVGDVTLDRLSYRVGAASATNAVTYGKDGAVQTLAAGKLVSQTAPTDQPSDRLDGWLAAGDNFAAMRWMWQQYPSGVRRSDGQAYLDLYAPKQATDLRASAHVIEPLKDFTNNNGWDVANDVAPGGPMTARGIAKTYDVIRFLQPNAEPAELKGAIIAQPVYAYVDPEFATAAGLPRPASARKDANDVVEQAIDNVFSWLTRQRASEHDFGAFNWGDVQYDWRRGFAGSPSYRYWANNGTGWASLPWLLWLRSGDRRYRDVAEAHARHATELDIAHLADPAAANPNAPKLAGVMGGYYPVHAAWASGRPFGKEEDSEYLINAFYLTGDERYWDTVMLRQDLLENAGHAEFLAQYLNEGSKKASRELYRPLAELVLVYEATLSSTLKQSAETHLDVILSAQQQDGNFPNTVSSFYLMHGLCLAHRALPAKRAQVIEALAKQHAFWGSADLAGYQGQRAGPYEAWSALLLAEAQQKTDGLKHFYYRRQAGVSTVQTAAGDFHGANAWPNFVAADLLHSWLVVDYGITHQLIDPTPGVALPSRYFVGRFPPADGFKNRHLAFVSEKVDGALVVSVNFSGGEDQPYGARVRIFDPAGALVSDKSVDVDPSRLDKRTGPFRFDFSLAADGQSGAYAVEVSTNSKTYPGIAIEGASDDGNLRVTHGVYNKNLAAVVAHHGPSLFAARAKSAQSQLSYHGVSVYVPRLTISSTDGTLLCASSAGGTASDGLPIESACEVSAAPAEIVLLNSGAMRAHEKLTLNGFSPWVASTAEQWFDPQAIVDYDIQALFWAAKQPSADNPRP